MTQPAAPPPPAAPAPPEMVPVADAGGQLWYVPKAGVAEAVQRGGRVVGPDEQRALENGSTLDMAAAGAFGALETATGGASTALAGEAGVALGGQTGRQHVEQGIKATERANPITHIAGEALPLLAAPELAGELAPALGESAAGRAASFALPRFAEGVVQAAHLEGSQGVSEDLLDHDFTAQSYWAHAATPEVLLGGVLNVGIGAGFAGLKRAGASVAGRILGAGAEAAADDAAGASNLIARAQRAGLTSEEASTALAQMQDVAQRAAANPQQRGFFDGIASFYAKKFGGGSRDVENALLREFDRTVDRFASSDRVLDKTTREAVGHTDDLFKGLSKMNELQFGLKEGTVSKLVDPTRLTDQLDAAIAVHRAVGKATEEALSRVDVREGEIKKIWNTLEKLNGQIKEAAPAAGRPTASAAGKLYVALDDTKRAVGRLAKFGLEFKDPNAQLADDLYHTVLRPVLEDEGLWGQRLARMQAETNRTFSDGAMASARLRGMVGQVLETPGGRPAVSTEFGRMRGVLSELEHAVTPTDLKGLKAEVLQRVIDNTRGRARAMVDTMDLAPADVASLKRTVEAANALDAVVKRAHGEAAEARTLKELKAREIAGGSRGIVSSVTGMITNPVQTMHVLGSLKKAGDAVRKTIAGDAKSAVAGERLIPTVKAIGPTERRIATKAMQDVQTLSRRPDLLAARVDALIGPIAGAAPRVSASAAATATRFVSYMAANAPPPLPARLLDTEPRWADSDANAFYRKMALGMRPLTAFERMQRNELHEDQVEMLEQVFPDLMQEMRGQLLTEYREAAAKGQLGHLTSQDRQAISMMLGVPLDSTQTPEFTAAMQQAAMSDPAAQGAVGATAEGGGRPKKIEIDVSGMKTAAEKLGEANP